MGRCLVESGEICHLNSKTLDSLLFVSCACVHVCTCVHVCACVHRYVRHGIIAQPAVLMLTSHLV